MMNRHTILLSLGGTLYFDAITLINVFALTHLNFLARCSFFIIFAMAVGGSKMCGGSTGEPANGLGPSVHHSISINWAEFVTHQRSRH